MHFSGTARVPKKQNKETDGMKVQLTPVNGQGQNRETMQSHRQTNSTRGRQGKQPCRQGQNRQVRENPGIYNMGKFGITHKTIWQRTKGSGTTYSVDWDL